MPPEPLPWDRKDFFREKKHANGGYDRASEPLGGAAGARWRDTPSHGSRNEFSRCGFPSDFRRPPCNGKQGSWHVYPDDMSHGYPTARSGDRFFQDGGGGFRPSGPYRDGRYTRNFRESRPFVNQRDSRGHSWDYNHHHGAPSSGSGRLYDGKEQKSVEPAPPARLTRPQLDAANTSNLVRSEEQRDDSCDASKADTCRGVEKEESRSSDWKPFKWSRPVGLTSRDSGVSVSSDPKGSDESRDVKIDLPLKICTPDESSSGDAVGCLASPTSLDDTTSRKKPRLGWGEGLAKFEKKRVDVPDDSQTKSSSALSTRNIESMHSPAQNWADKSPTNGGFFECRSPTTPSSIAYSSSPGLDDKSYIKASELESDANKLSVSPVPRAQNHFEGISLNLEDMDSTTYCHLNGLLSELLQKVDYRSVDSDITKSALNKLLSWKGDISKVLESTEFEIDSLENELKSLKSIPGSNNTVPKPSSSLSIECKEKISAELHVQRCRSLPAVSSSKLPVGNMVLHINAVEDSLTKTKDECIDSPGTATSKFTELLSPNKSSSPNQRKHGHSMDIIFLETEKYEACSSMRTAGPSGPDSETMVTSGIAAVHDNMVVCRSLEDNSLDDILVSNKETALEASKILGKLLPSSDCVIESIETISSTMCNHNNVLKEKFLKTKQSLKFKERVLSLKYRALRYMWKEDLQLLSERKHQTKSQKKVESGSRSLYSGFQKHRSCVRSRVASPACNMSLVPSSKAVAFTSKLLSDPQIKCYRNDMKMPAIILDKKEKLSGFLSNNGLIQNPLAVEKEMALMNPWTADEKKIFLDKYAVFGKDFTKISSFLDRKTTADCINFYYKNHKSDCFRKAKKQQVLKKLETSAPTTRYLIMSEKRSKEMNSASLDMLGEASAILAHDEEGKKSAEVLSISGSDRKVRKMSSSYNIEDERETEAADVLAGICGSMSSEAMSSCVTSSADPGEGTQDWMPWKTRCPPTAEVTQNVVDDDNTCSDESCGNVEPVDWTDEEKSSFMQAFSSYGKDFGMISQCVETKSRDECKVFFSKARKCLGLEMERLSPQDGDEELQTADDDLDGGQSDTEDACVVENDVDKSDIGTNENTPMTNSELNDDDRLDSSDVCGVKETSQNQDCQLEKTIDDGAVLNETVVDEMVTNEARIDTPPNQQHKIVAEFASEKSVGLAPFGNELKRSASASNLDQRLRGQTPFDFRDSCSSKSSLLPSSFQPLQVYLKKCQRSASVQSTGSNHQQQLSDSDKSCKNVKIFGQILGKSTTTEKPASDISSTNENIPIRRNSFWEGNRIPDSALLLARYPAIFGTSEPPLPLPLPYKPVYTPEQDKIQQFRLEMKPLSEAPRNGFEAVPGLQQIELNVVHGDSRSVLSRNGLTDPVAALKLHYAKTHQQSGGDLGR